MRGVSVLFSLVICTAWATPEFLNNKPYPTYSLENMPKTEFTCRDKILGGYYADPQTQCQMFHICVKVAGVGIQDFRFLCPNGTAFDQDHQICAEWEDVDCDAATLYYSSDNFDLYRIGSGFESKAVKYGEDEETFALQKAETGDTRLNREHQSGSVNQQREIKDPYNRANVQRQPATNDRDIFKGSSSSNFFNNRNSGKEKDEDYDDNANPNQNRELEKKKVIRPSKQRRPLQRGQSRTRVTNTETTADTQTTRASPRPSTFLNNFAGSSYIPTTAKPVSTTINNEQYTTAVNNYRGRNGQRRQQQQNEENGKQTETNPPSTTSSTPASSRQTQQYNTPPNRQPTQNDETSYYSTTQAPKRDTEIYTAHKQKQTTPYDDHYDTSKLIPTTKTDNYPIIKSYDEEFDAAKKTTPFGKTENYPSNNPLYFDKKQTTPLKQTETYPTTFPPKPKPFTASNEPASSFPTTFAPRTNTGFSQIVQQTELYTGKPSSSTAYNTQKSTFGSTLSDHFNSPTKSSTPTSTYSQYTPTVPKISSTTPFSRSNRFDETSYDDDFFNDKKEDEFLKTAHSQNIAASRNEYAKSTKQVSTVSPQFESPRPFSVTPNTPKATNAPTTTTRESSSLRTGSPKESETSKTTLSDEPKKHSEDSGSKKAKDSAYDYAYYDSNPNSEPEYDIDTEFKKSTVHD